MKLTTGNLDSARMLKEKETMPEISERRESDILLAAKNVGKYFPVTKGLFVKKKIGEVRAVDGVSFFLEKGKTLTLVGESGSGKTTLGKLIFGALQPSFGSIFFDGKHVAQLSKKELKEFRKHIGVIFQDPMSSLDPRLTIEQIVAEPIEINEKEVSKKRRQQRVEELLEKVGLRPSDKRKYPVQFSGGQRQRIAIARALALSPKLIVADEAVSALDVSVQAKIINLLVRLQNEFKISFLFITHDLGVASYVSHRIAVMYLGKICEFGSSQQIFSSPLHPYTRALISAIPQYQEENKIHASGRIVLSGEVPSPMSPPSGCRFRTRCKYSKQFCSEKEPELVQAEDGHLVACHYYKEIAAFG